MIMFTEVKICGVHAGVLFDAAQLQVMCCKDRKYIGLCKLFYRFSRCKDPVCGIGAFIDLVDQRQHRFLLSGCFDYFLNVQQFGIKCRDAFIDIVCRAHGGADCHPGNAKARSRAKAPCIGKNGIDADAAQKSSLS